MPSIRPRVARSVVLLATCVFAAAAAAGAAKPAAAPAVRTGLENLEKQVQEFTLSNGLRFVVVERHQAPVFSFFTVVNSGSANDLTGTTGLAHMMEHMAFKGSSVVGTSDWTHEKAAMGTEEHAYEALLSERRKGRRPTRAPSRKLSRHSSRRRRRPTSSSSRTRRRR